MTEAPPSGDAMVGWLRQVSPYFQQHRGKTFVVCFGGAAVQDGGYVNLLRDLMLLAAVGVRLVVVFGARPQIEAQLMARALTPRLAGGLRVSDRDSMQVIREVVGAMRLELEAAFSFGSRGGPFGGTPRRVASGNFVIARPAGIVDGVDLMFTGQVRSVDRDAISARLAAGEIVLLPPLGFSPTGELFNLRASELAASVASEIGATKLILLSEHSGIANPDGSCNRQLTLRQARALRDAHSLSGEQQELLTTALAAVQQGVERVHVVSQRVDGAVLRELFTRDGIGTLLSNAPFDQVRQATIDDVGGILELVQPLEQAGVLVKRSREKLEAEIEHFVVMERERTVVACAALYPYADSGMAEIACVAVHPDYRGEQFGDRLLAELETDARTRGDRAVFVLTTQATQWFGERGFRAASLEDLPLARRELYNYQRNSAVMIKALT